LMPRLFSSTILNHWLHTPVLAPRLPAPYPNWMVRVSHQPSVMPVDEAGQSGHVPLARHAASAGPYRLHMARALGIVAILLGLAMLHGWGGGIQTLEAAWPDLTTLQPLGAASFILAGAALVLAATVPALAAPPALLVLLIAAYSLTQR